VVPLPVLISGFAMGCIYALVALGYVFIWNAMAIINFAQGEFLMFAAFIYVATFSVGLHFGFGVSLLLTGAAMGLLGAVFPRTVYSPPPPVPTRGDHRDDRDEGVPVKGGLDLLSSGVAPFYPLLGTRLLPLLGRAVLPHQLITVDAPRR